MNNLLKKVSYLQGLAEGLGVDETSNEGKLLLEIIDVLGDFTEVLGETVEEQIGIEEYVNFIDEDLSDLEDEFYDEFDEFDEFYDFDDYEEFELDDDCLECGDSCDCDNEEE
ncbi:MAG: CD1247 N-terminal domain-containing protein [Tissierella sp.]|uniref:CD1247 N-terminal domain-containing protein n=1 Tax=Tissierella sp. TaxID=41274 RepID=UPI003F99BB8A